MIYLTHHRLTSAFVFAFITLLLVMGCSSTPKEMVTSNNETLAPTPSIAEETILASDEIPALEQDVTSLVDTPPLVDSLARSLEPVYLEDDQEISSEASFEDTAVTTTEIKSPPAAQDLWDRIRSGYALELNARNHKQVAAHERWYTKHPKYIERTFERARPFLFEIVERLEAENMPLEIVLLPVVESAFQPFAYSHGRASGLWQFIPGTAKQYGLTIDWWYDERRDILASTDAAVTYLNRLNKRFKGDWLLALAAYNSGEGTVERAIRKNKRKNKPTDFWHLSLPKETRGYVPRLLAISNIVAQPELFKVNLKSIPNEVQLGKVDVGSQIDIALAAELAGMKVDAIYNLNPAINRWATPPSGPHTLLLPKGKVLAFNENLNRLPESKRVKWKRHRVKSGETLGHIARNYRTTTAVLTQVNNIKGSLIRVKQHLIIPVAQRSAVSYNLSADQRLNKTKNSPRKGKKKTNHIVRSGDSLWEIAKKHKVKVSSLASWNGMAPKDTLRIGQKLVIWKQSSNTSANAKNKHASMKMQRIRYTVRKGDSLSRIAANFNTTVAKIQKWNDPLKKQKYLKPGQVLTLFVDVTRTAETG